MTRTAPRFLALALAAACAPGAGDGDGDVPDPPPGYDDPEAVPPGTHAVLEIHAMDLWAQYLPGAALAVSRDGGADLGAAGPVARIPLVEPGRFAIELGAPEHEPVAVTFDYDGSRSVDGGRLVSYDAVGRAGVATAHARVDGPDGDDIAVHAVFVGLRHRWFSASGRPARRGNDVELLMDGEEAYVRVQADVEAAARSILVSTWWWESDFELTRPAGAHPTMSEPARRANTILSLLEASAAFKRVIVGQFVTQDGLLSWMTSDAPLWAHAEDPTDDIEMMGQANETSGQFVFAIEPFSFAERVRGDATTFAWLAFDGDAPIESTIPSRLVDLTEMPTGIEINHASYHQKFLVVDDEVAYIGGMNLRRTDWDTSAHRVFEPRRMLFDATVDERLAVAAKDALPDQGPRKDYMIRVEGPAAQDAADVFARRWQHLRDQGVEYADATSSVAVERDVAPRAGGVQAQVTTTLPDPFWEHSIAESWLNAIAQAEQYIYIEDQYFRAPMLTEAILTRMAEVPGLRLVVITKPVDEWTDPGCYQTYIADEALRAAYPDRYLLLQLRAFDSVVTWGWDETESRFADIDVHSKLLVVDDVFLSVGSANKNNRAMLYEAEMNLAVLDGAWVRAARRRVLANMLPPGTPATDDPAIWWDQLATAAAANQQVSDAWDAEGGDISLDGAPLPAAYAPAGFLYPLAFRSPDYCFIEGIGDDMFRTAPRSWQLAPAATLDTAAR